MSRPARGVALEPANVRTLDGLFVLASLASGGTERKVLRTATELIDRGRNVAVAYLGEPASLLPSVPVSLPVFNLQRKGKLSFVAIKNLAAIVRSAHPGTIFAAQLYSLLYVRAAARLVPSRSGRCVAMVNTSTFVRTRDKLFMTLYKPLLRGMDEIVFGCDAQRRMWCDRYGLDEKRSSVIYNGVDTSHFSPSQTSGERETLRQKYGLASGSTVIGTVGRGFICDLMRFDH